MGTLIHFLITADSFSAMHRLPTVEHWFHHLGDAIEMLVLKEDGSGELVEIGPDFRQGQNIHYATPERSWQGSRVRSGGAHGWALGSCVMVPGFEWTDFELGDESKLCHEYPAFRSAIKARCRDKPVDGTL